MINTNGCPVEVDNPRPQHWVTPDQATINIVDTAATQSLTNKTLETPAIAGGTMAETALTDVVISGSEMSTTITSLNKAKGTVTTLTGATDAIDISLGDIFILNRSGAVNAATLAAPAAGDEGRIIWIMNGTTQANTIAVETTEGLGGSGASYNLLTFTNVTAANVTLRAYGLHWYMVGQYLTAVS